QLRLRFGSARHADAGLLRRGQGGHPGPEPGRRPRVGGRRHPGQHRLPARGDRGRAELDGRLPRGRGQHAQGRAAGPVRRSAHRHRPGRGVPGLRRVAVHHRTDVDGRRRLDHAAVTFVTAVDAAGLRADAAGLAADLTTLRRAIHREPEIGLDLPRTQAAVLAALADLGLEITTGQALTSVTAVLRGARPGPAVLLRADMDALPIDEPPGLEYAATNGAMHACGHDLHTAALVGAARLLAARRAQIAGSVIFMFQPGEEGYDGAGHMLAEGVLDAAGTRPVAAFALHNGPGEAGMFVTRPGPIL